MTTPLSERLRADLSTEYILSPALYLRRKNELCFEAAYVIDTLTAELAQARERIAGLEAEIATEKKTSEDMLDRYATENQQIHDRALAAEAERDALKADRDRLRVTNEVLGGELFAFQERFGLDTAIDTAKESTS